MNGARKALLPFVAAALLASGALAAVPALCSGDAEVRRAPDAVLEYYQSLAGAPFDMRVACARWAGTFSRRHQAIAARPIAIGPGLLAHLDRSSHNALLNRWRRGFENPD